jgi:predicted RNase H-like HicB family nuclease
MTSPGRMRSGKAGGKAQAEKLTKEQRRVIANKAAMARGDCQSVPINITSLDKAAYSLVQPIVITLQESDGEYVVSFSEAEIVTSGDTPGEAVKWMKESIVSTFELLRAKRVVLGPLPKRQLQALEQYIVKKQIRKA